MNKIYLEFTINVPELRKKKGERETQSGGGKRGKYIVFIREITLVNLEQMFMLLDR